MFLGTTECWSDTIGHMVTDSQPSGIVVSGLQLEGIPQGCPFATFLCNLAGCCWIQEMADTCPGCTCTTYLDDWLMYSENWAQLVQGWEIGKRVVAAFGPSINLTKTFLATASMNRTSA